MSRERRNSSGLPLLIVCIIAAVVFALVALMLSQGLVLLGVSLPDFMQDTFWDKGHLGLAHAYTLVTTVLLLIWRAFSTDAFSYKEITSGQWEFAVECGRSVKGLLFRKHLGMFLPTMFSYCFGAAITFGSGMLLLPEYDDRGIALGCYLMGAMALMLVLASESVVAALGLEDSLLSIMVFTFSGAVIAVWHKAGFLNIRDASAVKAGIRTFVDPEMPLFLAIVVMSYLLALFIAMEVPKTRIPRSEIGEMDEDLFGELEIPEGFEILEKNGEEMEVVFSPDKKAKK